MLMRSQQHTPNEKQGTKSFKQGVKLNMKRVEILKLVNKAVNAITISCMARIYNKISMCLDEDQPQCSLHFYLDLQ